jgi:hypothetical protein
MTHFGFLQREWPDVREATSKAKPTAILYESPFTDHAPHGPNGLFSAAQVEALVAALASVPATAAAA